MAIHAKQRRLPEFLACKMAGITLHSGMSTIESKVGYSMIEGLGVEFDYIGIAAFVVGMAVTASIRRHILAAAMKPCLIANIDRNVLVAIEA